MDGAIVADKLEKYYGGLPVLCGFSFCFRKGGVYCLEGESGAGKTTLLRLLAGLERADGGQLAGLSGVPVTMAFQEDRLCGWEDAVTNVALAVPCREDRDRAGIAEHLRRLLLADCLGQPVETFSGGMKRRVALVRALYPDSALVLLDEPFNGLDEETRLRAIQYVREERRGRTLIFSTHRPEEGERLGAQAIRLEKRRL